MKRIIFALIVISLAMFAVSVSALASDKDSSAVSVADSASSARVIQNDTSAVYRDKDEVLKQLQAEYRRVNEVLNASYTIEQNEMAVMSVSLCKIV